VENFQFVDFVKGGPGGPLTLHSKKASFFGIGGIGGSLRKNPYPDDPRVPVLANRHGREDLDTPQVFRHAVCSFSSRKARV
jgi:hypothetical protein